MDRVYDFRTGRYSRRPKPRSEVKKSNGDGFLAQGNPNEIVQLTSDDEHDEEEDDGSFVERLTECLDECRHQGKFSSSRTYEEFPTPGITVKNLGIIGLPLSVREAKAIAGQCKQSPFGKGDETLVDESVRKTWELDADDFSCSNPQWTSYVDKLADQSMKDLGVQVMGHAQPYKLLLYEEGAFFKAHRDTEKVPGMFGTLVVCLPSVHEGGSVRLVHGKEVRTVETASQSAFKMTTLAWYSDVQHEILPVTSGYRLVLTYNLVHDQSIPKQTAAALDASHAKLGNLLQEWNDDHSYQYMFVYPLEHQYTPTSLEFRNLKGQDAAKGRYLDALCSMHGAYWFLARMTKEAQEEEYYGEDEEDTIVLSEPVIPHGEPIMLNLPDVDEDSLLANFEEFWDDRDADSEDEGEYTGNENMPSALRYHDTVAVMIRKDHVLKLFAQQSSHSVKSIIAFLALINMDKHCGVDYRRKALNELLRQALHTIVQKPGGYGYGSGLAMYLPHDLKDKADYVKVFEKVADYCNVNGHSDLVATHLRKQMDTEKWNESEELVGLAAHQVAKDAAKGREQVWDSW